jgi:hypothetical protein
MPLILKTWKQQTDLVDKYLNQKQKTLQSCITDLETPTPEIQ